MNILEQFFKSKEKVLLKEYLSLGKLPEGWTRSSYNPYGWIEGYETIQNSKDNRQYLVSLKFGYVLRIKPGGYIPRSGLILCDYLNGVDIFGKEVFDIGTGEMGIIAIHCASKGADRVVASDIDSAAVMWAEQNAKLNNLSQISWAVGDIYDVLDDKQKFDFIISNPPQLPMSYVGTLHDYGGRDGRSCIRKIIKGAPNYLKEKGELLLLVFDFLNSVEQYNSDITITEIAARSGFRCRLVGEYTKYLRPKGETEKFLAWIKTIYPVYQFRKEGEKKLSHKIHILSITK